MDGGSLISGHGLNKLKNMIFLDIGSGDGSSSVLLRNEKALVISLDYDKKELKKRLKKTIITKGYAILADARHLPLKNASFNLVSSRYFLHCIKAHKKCLEEMKRVIKPKGRIQIIDICAPIKKIRDFLEKCHFENVSPLSRQNILTKEELICLLAGLGFHIHSMEWSTLKEKETSRNIKKYAEEEIAKNLLFKKHIKIRRVKRNFYIYLPVVTIVREKRTTLLER
jgi:ubiquinone/menaquinone biosynthesis C-methylase UbiE